MESTVKVTPTGFGPCKYSLHYIIASLKHLVRFGSLSDFRIHAGFWTLTILLNIITYFKGLLI